MPNDDDEFEQSKKRIYTLRFGNLKTDMFYKQLLYIENFTWLDGLWNDETIDSQINQSLKY